MTLMFKNNANSRLKIDTGAVSTTVTVLAGEGDRFPMPVGDGSNSFPVTLEDRRTGQVEIMSCTARSGDILTVTRALEGTAAQNFLAGATVSSRPTAGLWQQIFGYGWSKSEADARYVDVAGDVMTGPLTLPGDPVDPEHATTKSWVETLVGSVTSLTEAPVDGQAYVRKDADWAVGVTKTYVDNQDAGLNSLIGGLDADITALQAEIDALELTVGGKVDDAPADGNFYARSDGAWVETVSEGEYDVFVSNTNASLDTKIPEAPTDGAAYVRASAAWVVGILKSTYDAFVTATNGTLTAHGNNLTTINADQVTQNNRLTAVETKNTNQDTAINLRLTDAPSDGLVYGRKNAGWATVIGGAATDDNPPAGPLQDGQLWWQSSTGNTFIWYVDVNGGQWVQQNISTQAAADGQVGEVVHFARPTAPPGFLECNGASYPITTFPALFEAIQYTFGGSGANFNVPQLQGEFIRGWSNGRAGVDAARVFGSAQLQDVQPHTHIVSTVSTTTGGSTTATSLRTSSGQVPSDRATDNGVGTETRPRNVALLPCIRYLPTVEDIAPIQPGAIRYDVVQGLTQAQKTQAQANLGSWETIFVGPPTIGGSVQAFLDLGVYRKIRLSGVVVNSVDASMQLFASVNNGAAWLAGASDYTSEYSYGTIANTQVSGAANSSALALNIAQALANQAWEFEQEFYNFNLGVQSRGLNRSNVISATGHYMSQGAGFLNGVVARNAIKVQLTAGVFVSGTWLHLEGIRG